MNRRDYFVGIIPALFAIPLLDARIPIFYHSMRELTQYFQANAFLATGLESFTYLTPHETRGGFHIYSLLSAPFIELGYIEAGRLVSLMSAVVATLLLSYTVYTLTESRDTALFSALILWIQPLFFRHAYSFTPEALSIALTTGAVAATIRYLRTDQTMWYWLALLAVVVGVWNHTWEATIILPVAGLLIYHGQRLRALAVVAVTAGWVLLSRMLIRTLDPAQFSYSDSIGIHVTGPIFLSPDWWLNPLSSLHPFSITIGLMLPLSLLATLVWVYLAYENRSELDILALCWFCCGLSIPFMLPGALPWHKYYLWGLIVPLAITGGVIARMLGDLFINASPDLSRTSVMRLGFALLILAAGVNGVIVEGGALEDSGVPVVGGISGVADNDIDGIPSSEPVRAGLTVREQGAHDSTLVFVGDWNNASLTWQNSGRVLVYSGINIRNFTIQRADNVVFANNSSDIDCDFVVTRTGDEIRTNRC